jgi:hypothetical protein
LYLLHLISTWLILTFHVNLIQYQLLGIYGIKKIPLYNKSYCKSVWHHHTSLHVLRLI